MKTRNYALAAVVVASLAATVALAEWPVKGAPSEPAGLAQDRLNVDFTNATAQEVLDWLKKAGVNFVAETSTLPKDKRLTLHLQGKGREEVLEAVADALGLNVTKKNDIYTLKRGWDSAGSLPGMSDWRVIGPEFGKELGQSWKSKMSDEDWKKFGEKWDKWGEEFGKAWEKRMSDKDWEKFGEDMGKWGEELSQKMKGKDGVWEFKELPGGDWQLKEVPGADKIDKELELRLKEMPKIELREMPELQQELRERLKDMPRVELKEMPDVQKMLEKRMKEMPDIDAKVRERLKNLPQIEEKLKNVRIPKMEFGDIGKLVDSLTPEQLEKNKTRGYLTMDDLTPEQRAMFGKFDGEGDFTVKFEKDGKSVTFKRK